MPETKKTAKREGKYIVVDPDCILTEKAKKKFKAKEEAKQREKSRPPL